MKVKQLSVASVNSAFIKIVMNELEKYVRTRDINLLLLGTSDHQAPWFYEKIGYKRSMTMPKHLKDYDGQYVNSYHYVKTLV